MDLIDLLTDLYNVLWTPFEMLFKKVRSYSNRVSSAVLLDDNVKNEFLLYPQVADQLKHNPKTKYILLTIEKQSRNQQGCRVYGLSANNKHLWDMVVKYNEGFIKQGVDYIIVL